MSRCTGLGFRKVVKLCVYFGFQLFLYISISTNTGHKKIASPVPLTVGLICVCVYVSSCTYHMCTLVHVSSLCLQMLYEIGQAQSKPCGINLAHANTLGGLLIIEKASAPINVAL